MTPTLFLSSFVFIFLAATPGRTTFVLILLGSHGRLKKVFVGAAAAFLVQCVISVMLGEVLALISAPWRDSLAGLLFIYFAYSYWKDGKKSLTHQEGSGSISAKSVFLVIFTAEFGDVSQLAIATSAAASYSKLTIFASAVSALWVLTALALICGRQLRRVIRPHVIQRFASVVFLCIGLLFVARGTLLRR